MKKEAKIAVVVTIIIFLFFWGYNFLKGRNLFSTFNYYSAIFENVDGLQESNIVTINGFTVGLVSDIRFESERLDRLIVEIGVKNNFRIPENSVMMLASDLLGNKSVTLLLGDSENLAVNGSVLRDSIASSLIESITGSLLPIADNANRLIGSVDSLMHSLQNTFDDEMQKNIQNVVANVEQMILSERRKIAAILTNFESISNNLQKNNEGISKMIANLTAFSETLTASAVKNTVDNANRSLTQPNTLLSGINEGQGTLGKLANDDSLYTYLTRAAYDLDKLLIDLRENPHRYVQFSIFGGRR